MPLLTIGDGKMKNAFLRTILILTMILCVLTNFCFANTDKTKIKIDNKLYIVHANGGVTDMNGTAIQNQGIRKKAHYTAMVVNDRIIESKYNELAFAGITKTMIELKSLVKPLAGAYAYVFLSSTGMTSSLIEGGAAGGAAGALGNIAKDISKDTIIEITKEIVEHPEKAAMEIADDAYALSLQAYKDNHKIYKKVKKKGEIISYEDAVTFMANEHQKEILGASTQLISNIRSKKYEVGKYKEENSKEKELKQSLLTKLADMKSDTLGTKVEMAFFMTKFKPIFEEALAGLDDYQPYLEYKQSIESLDQVFLEKDQAYYQFEKPVFYDSSKKDLTKWDSENIQSPVSGPSYISDNETVSDNQIVSSNYEPVTKMSGEKILKQYKSVPGGVTLEGDGVGITDIKSIRFEKFVNAFIINDDSAYVLPTTILEMKDILNAIAESDKMGVSLAGDYIVYGAMGKSHNVNLSIRLVDKFLGDIAFAKKQQQFQNYKLANGYIPKENKKKLQSGMCVYFKFCDYTFRKRKTLYELDSYRLAITLVPTKVGKKAEDGGALPDFKAIEKGEIPIAWRQNVEHITSNVEYYMNERIMRMVKCYGEAAAFARALKYSGIDLAKLASSMTDSNRKPYQSIAESTPKKEKVTNTPASTNQNTTENHFNSQQLSDNKKEIVKNKDKQVGILSTQNSFEINSVNEKLEIAMLLFTEEKYCQAQTILKSIVSKHPNTRLANTLLEKCRAKCVPNVGKKKTIPWKQSKQVETKRFGIFPIFIVEGFSKENEATIHRFISQDFFFKAVDDIYFPYDPVLIDTNRIEMLKADLDINNFDDLVLNEPKVIPFNFLSNTNNKSKSKVELDQTQQKLLEQIFFKENLKYILFTKIKNNHTTSSNNSVANCTVTMNVYKSNKVVKPVVLKTFHQYNSLSALKYLPAELERLIKENSKNL
jgi:hypothetical protein